MIYDTEYFYSITGSDIVLPKFITDSTANLKEMYAKESALCIKSHLPWELLPKQIQEGTQKPKVLIYFQKQCFWCILFKLKITQKFHILLLESALHINKVKFVFTLERWC